MVDLPLRKVEPSEKGKYQRQPKLFRLWRSLSLSYSEKVPEGIKIIVSIMRIRRWDLIFLSLRGSTGLRTYHLSLLAFRAFQGFLKQSIKFHKLQECMMIQFAY